MPSSSRSAPSAISSFFIVFLRLALATVTRTFFQPDEFFQSLEIAHRVVYGYGHLTWEWTAQNPIRSAVFPFLWVPVYQFLSLAHLDVTQLLILAPKILSGMYACITDLCMPILATKILGERYATTATLLSLISFFHGLSLLRSMSNSLETSLTTAGLAFWPWKISSLDLRKQVRRSTLFAVAACIIRPTNAVIWVYMFALFLWRIRRNTSLLLQILSDTSIIGLAGMSFIFLIDSAFYRKATFTPLNFLRANASPISLFFGTNPWHFYITQALPLLCFTSFPFCFHGMWICWREGLRAERDALGLIIWTIAVYSTAGHKEWRFLHPILPLLLVFGAKSLLRRFDKHTAMTPNSERRAIGLPIRVKDLILLSLALPALIYTNVFHSSAQIDVMHYLRSVPPEELRSVGFVMPCHSTPWQAYLHRQYLAEPGRLWAIGCEPPLAGQDLQGYQDQSDVFYMSPMSYFHSYFPPEVSKTYPPSAHPTTPPGSFEVQTQKWEHEWPSHLVLFQELLDRKDDLRETETVRELLSSHGYASVWIAPDYGEEDPRRRGGITVWRHQA